MPISKLQALVDSLAWAVPFSIVATFGTIFGDAIRKDALTVRQRLAVGLFSFVMGPLMGAAANREFGLGEFTSYVVAAIAPTVIYDLVGLAAALLRSAKDDPRGWLAALKEIFPWGRR